jgi:hypothetical protein
LLRLRLRGQPLHPIYRDRDRDRDHDHDRNGSMA